mgnify:CR=1 FL=1
MKHTIKTRFWNVIFRIKRFLKLYIRRLKSQEVLAVYDSDLDDLLKKLNLYDKVEQSKFSCKNCRTIITRDNLGIITNENDKIQIYCISTGCSRSHYNLEVND